MEPREDQKPEPPKAPEPRREEPKLRRFRIVKLEERIAPLAGGDPLVGEGINTRQAGCR